MTKPKLLPILPNTLRMVAWEVTRRCNLACIHCRASSLCGPYQGELDTAQCLRLLDEIAAFSQPIIILTGGEPLLREDIFDIADHGNRLGLRMVLATNGTLLTEEMVAKMLRAGIRRVSVSLDGPDRRSHDAFRGVPGAFEAALRGIDLIKKGGMEFQINTTITQQNLNHIQEILDLTVSLGAAAHHIFLLVPTGRGKDLGDQAISAEAYEKTLEWFHRQSRITPIQLKATCAPHYFRVVHQKKRGAPARPAQMENRGAPPGLHAMTRACLGGSAFCFISHTGQVQPCGYLELDCGQIREKPFADIWNNSPIFEDLRDLNRYKGKCGVCPFIRVCGGCRARAYELTGDYLAEEPLCAYEPARNHAKDRGAASPKTKERPSLDELDRRILNCLQTDFPVNADPFRIIGEKMGLDEEAVLTRIRALKAKGLIRRIGAVFNPDRLGFISTLCAAQVPDDKADLFVKKVNALPGVTHHYRRDHEYNYWFTLICPSREAIRKTLSAIEAQTGVAVISMPAVKTFKINASFQL